MTIWNGPRLMVDAAAKGWTASMLAAKAGVSASTISYMRRGGGTATTWARVAQALGYTTRRYLHQPSERP